MSACGCCLGEYLLLSVTQQPVVSLHCWPGMGLNYELPGTDGLDRHAIVYGPSGAGPVGRLDRQRKPSALHRVGRWTRKNGRPGAEYKQSAVAVSYLAGLCEK